MRIDFMSNKTIFNLFFFCSFLLSVAHTQKRYKDTHTQVMMHKTKRDLIIFNFILIYFLSLSKNKLTFFQFTEFNRKRHQIETITKAFVSHSPPARPVSIERCEKRQMRKSLWKRLSS
jgi:hypothetical protein